ncbi:MAG TPA: isoprenylcysteine carboxylmethyltransferase family protein [Caulobacteraceae bacterium]|nr:isoprenylcysteine carboxylmethyltransferase family protein [Caulobacteraceae bacterium]
MILSVVLLALVTAQRLGELVLANSNTKRLKAQGAYEVAPGHYPLIVILHAAWLIGLWWLAWNRPLNLALGALFLGIEGLRVWTLMSLGPRWTTRIIILPGAPLVRRGPYRFIPHPNYTVVAAEIAVLPLAFGLWAYALAFTVLNAAILFVRIRAENAALAAGQSPDGVTPHPPTAPPRAPPSPSGRSVSS